VKRHKRDSVFQTARDCAGQSKDGIPLTKSVNKRCREIDLSVSSSQQSPCARPSQRTRRSFLFQTTLAVRRSDGCQRLTISSLSPRTSPTRRRRRSRLPSLLHHHHLLVTYLVLLLYRRGAACSGFAACDSLFGAVRGSDTTRLYKYLAGRRFRAGYQPLRHSFAPSLAAWDRRGGSDMTSDFRKLESPSAERNKGPIWEVLARHVLPPILEDGERRSSKKGNQHVIVSKNDDVSDDDDDLSDQVDAIRVLEIAAGAGGTCDPCAIGGMCHPDGQHAFNDNVSCLVQYTCSTLL
jgi:hypothetical protein